MLLFRSQYSMKKYVTGTQLCGLRDHQGLMWKISLLIGRGHFLIVILRKTHVCWVKILGVWRAGSSPDTTLRMELKSWSIQKRFNPIVRGVEDEIQHAKHRNSRKCRIFFSKTKQCWWGYKKYIQILEILYGRRYHPILCQCKRKKFTKSVSVSRSPGVFWRLTGSPRICQGVFKAKTIFTKCLFFFLFSPTH